MTPRPRTRTCPDCGIVRETTSRGSSGLCRRCNARRTPEQRAASVRTRTAHQATVDPDAVQRLIDGIPGDATRAERQAAAKHLADLRLPVDAIARRLSLHHDTVVRLLRRDDEPAAPRRIDLRLRTRTAVEQAIARGIPGDQIIADHAITYRQLREIRRGME